MKQKGNPWKKLKKNGAFNNRPMKVIAKSEKLRINSYGLGEPEKNPMFFEKRIYQGSNGKVYPVPFIDKVYDHASIKEYKAVILENDFVRLMMLPEMGGRIFEAQDKSNNDYDYFYRQEVIKPALVGLAGPWISGGVEFNWPQHHRPGTYLPSDVAIENEADGAKTVWMSEYDPMNRLKEMHGIRVRPNSSLVELRVRLFNRTPLTQTFLWWVNIAVKVHEQYHSFFPPDVHHVADHAVRAMSSFPFAENYYYGIPYHKRKGKNDLRRYQHIPVPTSFMVGNTNYDFFGGYDEKAEGGFVHVANRHIAPGKKQWTWGNDAFGKAWDRELTDQTDPYFELMSGVYTNNQPDFSYLLPYETKTFSQFWWSYKKIGTVQNANKEFAIRLVVLKGNRLSLGVASSKVFDKLTFVLEIGGGRKVFENITISPNKPWQNQPMNIQSGQEDKLTFTVFDQHGKEQLTYSQRKADKTRNVNIATEPPLPGKVKSASKLKLIAEHLDLYRHPTRYPEPYLNEAIKRDAFNHEAHTLLGRIELRKGEFSKAEKHFRKSIAILTTYHPNPATGEPFYFCGLACRHQSMFEEAYGLFYKATWNFEWRPAGYYQLATIDCLNADFATALDHLEEALNTNRQNNKALILKAIIHKKYGKFDEAKSILSHLLKNDPLDQWAKFELATITRNFNDFLNSSRNDAQTIIDIATDYIEAGFLIETIELIELHHDNEVPEAAVPNPMRQSVMTWFLLAWLFDQNGDQKRAIEILKKAENASPDYFFPSRIYEQLILEWALPKCNDKTVVAFGLGNCYFDLKLHKKAIRVWEEAASQTCTYGSLHRNLGIAYWNTHRDGDKALKAYAKAIECSPENARIRYEHDQLRKKINDKPAERLADMEKLDNKLLDRDDFCIEYAALLNFSGRYQHALELLTDRTFHPWEGGEGQVLRQYTYSCLQLGRFALQKGEAKKALDYFNRSVNTPDSLGEKYHPLQAMAHINYWKGMAFKELGMINEANKHFRKSANEEGDFIDMAVSRYSEMTYSRVLSLIEIRKETEAKILLKEMKQFALAKQKDKSDIDYFATSLPLLSVFEDDYETQNQCEAKYVLALAEKALGNTDHSKKLLQEVLHLNVMHIGAKDQINQDRWNELNEEE